MNGKTQLEIDELPRLTEEKYENIFHVYETDGKFFYNLLQTLDVPKNLPAHYYGSYEVGHGDTWPVISYKVYNTTHLYWLILEANNIIDPTQQPVPGTRLRTFTKQIASMILAQINSHEV